MPISPENAAWLAGGAEDAPTPTQGPGLGGILGRRLVGGALPTVAGAAGAAGATSLAALAAPWLLGPEAGIPADIAMLALGLGGGIAGGAAGSAVQDAGLRAMPGLARALGQDPETVQRDQAANPVAFAIGGALPGFLLARPGAEAGGLGNAIRQGITMGGINAAVEGGRELLAGEQLSPLNIGVAAGSGALQTRQHLLGNLPGLRMPGHVPAESTPPSVQPELRAALEPAAPPTNQPVNLLNNMGRLDATGSPLRLDPSLTATRRRAALRGVETTVPGPGAPDYSYPTVGQGNIAGGDITQGGIQYPQVAPPPAPAPVTSPTPTSFFTGGGLGAPSALGTTGSTSRPVPVVADRPGAVGPLGSRTPNAVVDAPGGAVSPPVDAPLQQTPTAPAAQAYTYAGGYDAGHFNAEAAKAAAAYADGDAAAHGAFMRAAQAVVVNGDTPRPAALRARPNPAADAGAAFGQHYLQAASEGAPPEDDVAVRMRQAASQTIDADAAARMRQGVADASATADTAAPKAGGVRASDRVAKPPVPITPEDHVVYRVADMVAADIASGNLMARRQNIERGVETEPPPGLEGLAAAIGNDMDLGAITQIATHRNPAARLRTIVAAYLREHHPNELAMHAGSVPKGAVHPATEAAVASAADHPEMQLKTKVSFLNGVRAGAGHPDAKPLSAKAGEYARAAYERGMEYGAHARSQVLATSKADLVKGLRDLYNVRSAMAAKPGAAAVDTSPLPPKSNTYTGPGRTITKQTYDNRVAREQAAADAVKMRTRMETNAEQARMREAYAGTKEVAAVRARVDSARQPIIKARVKMRERIDARLRMRAAAAEPPAPAPEPPPPTVQVEPSHVAANMAADAVGISPEARAEARARAEQQAAQREEAARIRRERDAKALEPDVSYEAERARKQAEHEASVRENAFQELARSTPKNMKHRAAFLKGAKAAIHHEPTPAPTSKAGAEAFRQGMHAGQDAHLKWSDPAEWQQRLREREAAASERASREAGVLNKDTPEYRRYEKAHAKAVRVRGKAEADALRTLEEAKAKAESLRRDAEFQVATEGEGTGLLADRMRAARAKKLEDMPPAAREALAAQKRAQADRIEAKAERDAATIRRSGYAAARNIEKAHPRPFGAEPRRPSGTAWERAADVADAAQRAVRPAGSMVAAAYSLDRRLKQVGGEAPRYMTNEQQELMRQISVAKVAGKLSDGEANRLSRLLRERASEDVKAATVQRVREILLKADAVEPRRAITDYTDPEIMDTVRSRAAMDRKLGGTGTSVPLGEPEATVATEPTADRPRGMNHPIYDRLPADHPIMQAAHAGDGQATLEAVAAHSEDPVIKQVAEQMLRSGGLGDRSKVEVIPDTHFLPGVRADSGILTHTSATGEVTPFNRVRLSSTGQGLGTIAHELFHAFWQMRYGSLRFAVDNLPEGAPRLAADAVIQEFHDLWRDVGPIARQTLAHMTDAQAAEATWLREIIRSPSEMHSWVMTDPRAREWMESHTADGQAYGRHERIAEARRQAWARAAAEPPPKTFFQRFLEATAKLFGFGPKGDPVPSPPEFAPTVTMLQRFMDISSRMTDAAAADAPDYARPMRMIAKDTAATSAERTFSEPTTAANVAEKERTPPHIIIEAAKPGITKMLTDSADWRNPIANSLRTTRQLVTDYVRRVNDAMKQPLVEFQYHGSAVGGLRDGYHLKMENINHDWSRLPKAEIGKVTAALIDGTLAEDGGTRPSEVPSYQALSPKARAVVDSIYDFYRQQAIEGRDAIKAQITNTSGLEGRALEKELARVDSLFHRESYFPLHRFGDHMIRATKDGAESEAHAFTSRADAEAAAAAFEREGYEVTHTKRDPDQLRTPGSLDSLFLQRVKEVYRDRIAEAPTEAAKAELQSSLEEIVRVHNAMLPEMSALKSRLQRKGVAGYSTDGPRVFNATGIQNTSYLARLRQYATQRPVLDQLALKAKTVEEQELVHQLRSNFEAQTKYAPTPVTDAIVRAAFLKNIAGVPASLVGQGLQNYLLAAPQIGGRLGLFPGTAESALLASSMHVGGQLKHLLSGNIEALARNPAERAMLEHLIQHDVVNRSLMSALRENVDGGATGSMSKIMRYATAPQHYLELFNRVTTALAAHRLATKGGKTHAAAMGEITPELFRSLREQDPAMAARYPDTKAGHEAFAATRFAEDMVVAGHFDFTRENQPGIFGGNSKLPGGAVVRKIMGQFQSYKQGVIYELMHHGMQAIGAAKDLSPMERAASQRVFAGIVMSHATLTGLMGAPAALTVAAVYNIMHQMTHPDDPTPTSEDTIYNFLEHLAPGWGGVAARGVFYLPGIREFAPIDITSRAGLGDLLQVGRPPTQLGRQDIAAYIGSAVGGPAASMMSDLAMGGQKIASGDIPAGVELLMPRVARDIMVAMRTSQEGVRTQQGNIVVPADQMTEADHIAEMMGFQPQRVVRAWENRTAVAGAQQDLALRRTQITNQYVEARNNGDAVAMAAARQAMQRYNARQRELGLRSTLLTEGRMLQAWRQRQDDERAAQQSQVEGLALQRRQRDLAALAPLQAQLSY